MVMARLVRTTCGSRVLAWGVRTRGGDEMAEDGTIPASPMLFWYLGITLDRADSAGFVQTLCRPDKPAISDPKRT
jgi:hypothetical protein